MNRMKSTLSKSLLRGCAQLFDKEYGQTDEVLNWLFRQKFPKNADLEQISVKTSVLNALYGTNIYDVKRMAKHIAKMKIDKKLGAGEISLVEDIRSGHGIRKKKMTHDLNFYVFATKYASFHQPSRFPMIDSFVKRLLVNLEKSLIPGMKLNHDSLKDYGFFKEAIDSLVANLGIEIEGFNYKKVDQGLWLYGKYLYAKQNEKLPKALSDEIKKLLASE